MLSDTLTQAAADAAVLEQKLATTAADLAQARAENVTLTAALDGAEARIDQLTQELADCQAQQPPEQPPTPTVTRLDLDKFAYAATPYSSEPHVGTPALVTENGVRKVRVDVQGRLNSRNGGWYHHKLPTSIEDITVAYRMKFLPGYLIRGATDKTRGGGKKGVAIGFSRENGMSGGGGFYPDSAHTRTIYERADDGNIGLKTYLYIPKFGAWMEWEAARIIGKATGTLLYPGSHRWDHWECGGDRSAVLPDENPSAPRDGDPRYPGAAVRPTWKKIGNSRYVGFAGAMKRPDGSAFSFPVGQEIQVELRHKMNTFHPTATFDGGQWMPGRWAVPNQDGIYTVRVKIGDAAPITLWDTSSVVYRYAVVADAKWDWFEVGGFSGGPYNGEDGKFDVWDVRYGTGPILT